MHPHRLLHRALAAAAVASFGATVAFVAPASAHSEGKEDACRTYPGYPGSPNPWIKVVAEDNTFDTNCIKAPVNRNFRIYLQNNDSDPHNISIWSADPSVDKKAEQLYKGKAVKGPGQEEYAIEAMGAGKYWFCDDKVKTMNGYIQIPEKKK